MATDLPKVANWVGENTITTGTGPITLAGAIQGFAPFSVIGDGQVYYMIQEGDDKECGVGVLSGQSLQRQTVQATFINGVYSTTGQAMNLKGFGEVYCVTVAGVFTILQTALHKLDQIEPGAKGDQTAAEVPYDSSLPEVTIDNVRDMLDSLYSSIKANKSSSDQAIQQLTTDLQTETSQRTQADTGLQNNIDAEAQTRATADTQEAQTRASADTTLQQNIDAEESARQQADATLTQAIDQLREDTKYNFKIITADKDAVKNEDYLFDTAAATGDATIKLLAKSAGAVFKDEFTVGFKGDASHKLFIDCDDIPVMGSTSPYKLEQDFSMYTFTYVDDTIGYKITSDALSGASSTKLHIVNAETTGEPGHEYWYDLTNQDYGIIHFPPNPEGGMEYGTGDANGQCTLLRPIILKREAGINVEGKNEDYVLYNPNIKLKWVFTTQYGWKITDGIGENGNGTLPYEEVVIHYGPLNVDTAKYIDLPGKYRLTDFEKLEFGWYNGASSQNNTVSTEIVSKEQLQSGSWFAFGSWGADSSIRVGSRNNPTQIEAVMNNGTNVHLNWIKGYTKHKPAINSKGETILFKSGTPVLGALTLSQPIEDFDLIRVNGVVYTSYYVSVTIEPEYFSNYPNLFVLCGEISTAADESRLTIKGSHLTLTATKEGRDGVTVGVVEIVGIKNRG